VPVVLIFHRLTNDHTFATLDDVDARTVAAGIQLPPSEAGRLLGSRISTALRVSEERGGTSEVVFMNRHELESVHEACRDSLDMHRVRSLKDFCAEVARTLAG
jgi:hypothetical protein